MGLFQARNSPCCISFKRDFFKSFEMEWLPEIIFCYTRYILSWTVACTCFSMSMTSLTWWTVNSDHIFILDNHRILKNDEVAVRGAWWAGRVCEDRWLFLGASSGQIWGGRDCRALGPEKCVETGFRGTVTWWWWHRWKRDVQCSLAPGCLALEDSRPTTSTSGMMG